MKIYAGQLYITPGVSFPFSLQFQRWLGDELLKRVEPSEGFRKLYAENFDLGFVISAKSDIDQPEIKGPTVFKREKDVEYTIFLPYENRNYYDVSALLDVFRLLLQSIIRIMEGLRIDAAKVRESAPFLYTEFLAKPELMDAPHI
ncbi:hypothetical protein ACXR0O_04250 [Verrucomicrobiota bacterium sgz303538]